MSPMDQEETGKASESGHLNCVYIWKTYCLRTKKDT